MITLDEPIVVLSVEKYNKLVSDLADAHQWGNNKRQDCVRYEKDIKKLEDKIQELDTIRANLQITIGTQYSQIQSLRAKGM